MKKRVIILSIVFVLTIISAYFITKVETNYDLSLYLPKDSNTQEGLEVYEDAFGTHSQIELQIDDVSVSEVLTLKTSLQNVTHIEQVVWIDDYVDLTTTPLSYLDANIIEPFYQNENALLTLKIGLDPYDLAYEDVISDIDLLLEDYDISYRGEALQNIENRAIADHEIVKIMLIIVPIVVVILLVASHAWIEPIILGITLGVAIVLNLGSNALLDNVSYITKTMVMALQLALSLDYGLFLLHRFYEEIKDNDDLNLAIKHAYKRSFSSITASSLTTIAGFMSLAFMRYGIGMDIGLVMSKGILLSYITTLVLMPVLIYLFYPLIKKTMHPLILKPSKHWIKGLFKLRYILLVVFVLITVTALIFSSQTSYLYGNSQGVSDDSQVAIDQAHITETFGAYQTFVILVPDDNPLNEVRVITALNTNDAIMSATSLVTQVDPLIPRSMIPNEVKDIYIQNGYVQIIVQTSIVKESDAMYQLVDYVEANVETFYDNYYFIGFMPSTNDIKTIVTEDAIWIQLIGVIAILVILLITFKSFVTPILLVLLIEASIWTNIAILYIADIQTIYIGYIVVMSIQLGATIDYAVLMTHRYLDFRKDKKPIDAMHLAFDKSSMTLMISAMILASAGFLEGILSDISEVSDIGFLLFKGTLITLGFIMIFLPVILIFSDHLVYHINKRKALK